MEPVPTDPCPCGGGKPFESCCRPCIDDPRSAGTVEALMRSRYTAHVVGDVEHLSKTWHPRTRPATLALEPSQRWLGLSVRRVEQGEDGLEGVVEYVARFKVEGRGHRLHEISRFEKLDGRWFYVDGELVERRRPGKPGRR